MVCNSWVWGNQGHVSRGLIKAGGEPQKQLHVPLGMSVPKEEAGLRIVGQERVTAIVKYR